MPLLGRQARPNPRGGPFQRDSRACCLVGLLRLDLGGICLPRDQSRIKLLSGPCQRMDRTLDYRRAGRDGRVEISRRRRPRPIRRHLGSGSIRFALKCGVRIQGEALELQRRLDPSLFLLDDVPEFVAEMLFLPRGRDEFRCLARKPARPALAVAMNRTVPVRHPVGCRTGVRREPSGHRAGRCGWAGPERRRHRPPGRSHVLARPSPHHPRSPARSARRRPHAAAGSPPACRDSRGGAGALRGDAPGAAPAQERCGGTAPWPAEPA